MNQRLVVGDAVKDLGDFELYTARCAREEGEEAGGRQSSQVGEIDRLEPAKRHVVFFGWAWLKLCG